MSGIQSIKLLLSQLEGLLNKNQVKVINYLNDALSMETIDRDCKKQNIQFPQEVKELYLWKNGTQWPKVELGDLWIFPGGMFYPLESAIEYYAVRVLKDKYWKEKMFPIFGSGGGEFFLIDLNPGSVTYGQIYYYCLNDDEFEGIISYFDSLTSALETIIECYHKKVYYISDDGYLESDWGKERLLGAKHNLKSAYWKLFPEGQNRNIFG